MNNCKVKRKTRVEKLDKRDDSHFLKDNDVVYVMRDGTPITAQVVKIAFPGIEDIIQTQTSIKTKIIQVEDGANVEIIDKRNGNEQVLGQTLSWKANGNARHINTSNIVCRCKRRSEIYAFNNQLFEGELKNTSANSLLLGDDLLVPKRSYTKSEMIKLIPKLVIDTKTQLPIIRDTNIKEYKVRFRDTGEEIKLPGHTVEEWSKMMFDALYKRRELYRDGNIRGYTKDCIEKVIPLFYDKRRYITDYATCMWLLSSLTITPFTDNICTNGIIEIPYTLLYRFEPVLVGEYEVSTDSDLTNTQRYEASLNLGANTKTIYERLADKGYKIDKNGRLSKM